MTKIKEKILKAHSNINLDLEKMEMYIKLLEDRKDLWDTIDTINGLENWCRQLLTDVASIYCETITFCENVEKGVDKELELW